MADGSHFHNTASLKRGRTDDLSELTSKRQRNEVEHDTDESARREIMVQSFTEFIGDRDIAAGYVQLFMGRGPYNTPYVNCPPGFDERVNGMYSQALNPTNTMILFGILNGLIPGYTVGYGTNIWAYMTDEAYQLLKNFLITSFHYLQRGPQQIQLPPPPFQQALGFIGGSTPNLSSQQLIPLHRAGPGGHPQTLRNGASHSGMIGQQPSTSWDQGQFAHPNAGLVPSHSQPHHLTGAQTIQGLNPQAPQAHPVRPFPNLSPQARKTQQAIQQHYRTLQQQQQQATKMSLRQPQAIVETRSLPMLTTAGNHTQPPQIAEVTQQRSTPPSRSSTANPGAAQGSFAQTGNHIKVIGNGKRGSSLGLQAPEPINKRGISDSAVHPNQHLGQHLGQNIIHPVNNEPEVVPRSQTASGYHTNQYPLLSSTHSSSTSLISPIPTQSMRITTSGSAPLYGTEPNNFGMDPQVDLGWVHQPQGRSRVQKKAGTSKSGANLTFIMENGQIKTPQPQRRANSSKPKPVALPIQEEEEESAHQNNDATAAPENGVDILPTLQSHPAPAQQTVNDDSLADLFHLPPFQQFETEVEESPQQQQRDQAQQRLGSGATTPITHLSIPAAIPSSVAHTEAPQASTSSSLAYLPPIIAQSVSSFGLLFGSPSPPNDGSVKEGVTEAEGNESPNSLWDHCSNNDESREWWEA